MPRKKLIGEIFTIISKLRFRKEKSENTKDFLR